MTQQPTERPSLADIYTAIAAVADQQADYDKKLAAWNALIDRQRAEQGETNEQRLRRHVAEVILADIKRAAAPLDLLPGQVGHLGARTHYDLADAALAVVEPELAARDAENARLRAELATVRDATLHEAARVLEETGRDDDAVNLLDLLANSPARPGCPDPIECDHEAELGQLRAELEQTRQQIAAVLALPGHDDDQLEQMDPEDYQQAVGYNDALGKVQRLLAAAARPSA